MSLYNNTYLRINNAGFFNFSSAVGQAVNDAVSTGVNKIFNTELGQVIGEELNTWGLSGDLIGSILGDMAGQWASDQVSEYDALIQKQLRQWMRWGDYSYSGIPERKQYREFLAQKRARKNHFIIQISNPKLGDLSKKFNLFVTDIDLNPMNISGEKQKVGGTFVDTPSGSESTEVRITTMDDTEGTLKQWYERLCSLVVDKDGSVGVPSDYGVTITVLHAVVNGDNVTKAFQNKGLYRASNYEVQLTRREQAMQEITLTFTQIDPFMG